jgi:hypothetical protein
VVDAIDPKSSSKSTKHNFGNSLSYVSLDSSSALTTLSNDTQPANEQSTDFNRHGTYLNSPRKGRKHGKRSGGCVAKLKPDARVPNPPKTDPDPLAALKALDDGTKPATTCHCARAVTNALHIGGYSVDFGDAKDFGRNLEKEGWVKVAAYRSNTGLVSLIPGRPYEKQPLDALQVDPSGNHKLGHASGLNSREEWRSDINTKDDPYPANTYRRNKGSYEIWRYPGTAPRLANQLLAKASKLDPASPEAAKLRAMAQQLIKGSGNEALAGSNRQNAQTAAPRSGNTSAETLMSATSDSTTQLGSGAVDRSPDMVDALVSQNELLTTTAPAYIATLSQKHTLLPAGEQKLPAAELKRDVSMPTPIIAKQAPPEQKTAAVQDPATILTRPRRVSPQADANLKE